MRIAIAVNDSVFPQYRIALIRICGLRFMAKVRNSVLREDEASAQVQASPLVFRRSQKMQESGTKICKEEEHASHAEDREMRKALATPQH
jgi:hypothetical protein